MNAKEGKSLSHQLDVYFDNFPEINISSLMDFINSCDPDEPDSCSVDIVDDKSQKELRLAMYSVRLGDFIMAILIHSAPSPGLWVIEESPLPQPIKKKLAGHQSFAMLTVLGGENYAPYESQIFLLKVAMGLCKQGAIGSGNPRSGLCFPGELLLNLLDAGKESPEDEKHSLWKSLREDGEPSQLLSAVGKVDIAGQAWLVTRGFAFCGFPDFIYRLDADEDPSEILQFYENSFSYLMANGPVIEAGHTMGTDKDVAFRFSEPPSDLELPFDTYGLLLVTREKKKKRFGIF